MVTRPFPALSLVSNLSCYDLPRLERIVPHWLRVFGDRIEELVLVLDPVLPTGRIARLHREAVSAEVMASAVEALALNDSRVRLECLERVNAEQTLARWFRPRGSIRCQGGTPILAFVAAIDMARNDLVLRLDCDMVFSGVDWLEPTVRGVLAREWDLGSPPRVGESATVVSSRAFLLDRAHWRATFLPIRPSRLDPLRSLHRWLQGRPPWLALENTMDAMRQRGCLRHGAVDQAEGASLHVIHAAEAAASDFPAALSRLERGEVPVAQRARGWNFDPSVWRDVKPTS